MPPADRALLILLLHPWHHGCCAVRSTINRGSRAYVRAVEAMQHSYQKWLGCARLVLVNPALAPRPYSIQLATGSFVPLETRG